MKNKEECQKENVTKKRLACGIRRRKCIISPAAIPTSQKKKNLTEVELRMKTTVMMFIKLRF